MKQENLIDPTSKDLNDPMFEAIWQAIKGWDLSRNGGVGASYAGATGTDVMTVLIPVRETLVAWAVEQWREQVGNRPLQNIYRRELDYVWRKVIRRMGADDVSLIGPRHDELLKELK